MILTIVVSGCTSVMHSRWELTAWNTHGQENNVTEFGTIGDTIFEYDIIVTDLSKVVRSHAPQGVVTTKHPKALIAVAIRCRNKSNGTKILDADVIQMIDVSKTLAKKLTREQVIFKLYGGRMHETSQLGMIEELNKPIRTSPTLFGSILAAYTAAKRTDVRNSIINEMYQKEYSAYDIFHQSFVPSSLPSGISTVWVQYYHYTPSPIKIILQGQNVNEGLTFSTPPDEVDRHLNDLLTIPNLTHENSAVSKKKRQSNTEMAIAFGAVAGVVIFGSLLISIN